MAHIAGNKDLYELSIDKTWMLKPAATDGSGHTMIQGAVFYGGSVETAANLENVDDPEIGVMYNIQENAHNSVWNGDSWDDLGRFAVLSEEIPFNLVRSLLRSGTQLPAAKQC